MSDPVVKFFYAAGLDGVTSYDEAAKKIMDNLDILPDGIGRRVAVAIVTALEDAIKEYFMEEGCHVIDFHHYHGVKGLEAKLSKVERLKSYKVTVIEPWVVEYRVDARNARDAEDLITRNVRGELHDHWEQAQRQLVTEVYTDEK